MRFALFFLILFISFCQSKGAPKKEKEPFKETEAINFQEQQNIINENEILSPLDAIKDLDKKLDTYKIGANLTEEDKKYNQQLKRKIIRGTFDLYELCRLALNSYWHPLSVQERSQFVNLMTQLLEKKAVFSKEQVGGSSKPYQVIYKSEKYLNKLKTDSLVLTKVIVPSEKIDLNIEYKLKKTSYGWKIYDVIVDDASLVENYKFQFDSIIKEYGYSELVKRMEKKLKEME